MVKISMWTWFGSELRTELVDGTLSTRWSFGIELDAGLALPFRTS